MTTKSGTLSCTAMCWLIGALAGALTACLLWVLGGWSFTQGAFFGAIVFLIGGAALTFLFCRDLPMPGETVAEPTAKPAAAKPAPRPVAPASSTPEEPIVKPSAALAGEAELAERKGSWTYKADGGGSDAASTTTPPTETADGEEAPVTLTGPRDGGADDLKKLKGVGPKLEQTLHELGFYHFDQIAAWTPKQVAWVDSRLKFKGRIERDGWIDQAKTLAKGDG